MGHKVHVGLYAVILNDGGDSILLIRKARGPYTGKLDLPGGSIEPGELIEEALQREISCKVVSSQQLCTKSIRYPYQDVKTNEQKILKHIGILYSAKISGEPSKTGDGLDSGGADWVKISAIAEEDVTPFVLSGLYAIKEN